MVAFDARKEAAMVSLVEHIERDIASERLSDVDGRIRQLDAQIAAGNTEIPQSSGLTEIFEEISPIEDFTGQLSLELEFDPSDADLRPPPKFSVEECKEKDMTYAAPVFVRERSTYQPSRSRFSIDISKVRQSTGDSIDSHASRIIRFMNS